MTTLTGFDPGKTRGSSDARPAAWVRPALASVGVGAAALFALLGLRPDGASPWPAVIAAGLVALGTGVFGGAAFLPRLVSRVPTRDLAVLASLATLAAVIRAASGATWPAWIVALVLVARLAGALVRKLLSRSQRSGHATPDMSRSTGR